MVLHCEISVAGEALGRAVVANIRDVTSLFKVAM